jgi:adenosylmethionine-8-amino-7-oxononanoate aminotransferase
LILSPVFRLVHWVINNPRVNDAIKEQLDKYSHVMVYGEYSQSPAVEFCKLLASLLPEPLKNIFGEFGNRSDGRRSQTGAPRNRQNTTHFMLQRYHGNTMGSMSVMGFEERKNRLEAA